MIHLDPNHGFDLVSGVAMGILYGVPAYFGAAFARRLFRRLPCYRKHTTTER